MAKRKGKHIKDFLPPNIHAKTQHGYYTPMYPSKYDGDIKKIIYRSSWEYFFLRWCDESDNVIKYASEPFAIPYFNPITRRGQRYYVDFVISTKDKNGNIQKWIIEVKPEKFTRPPSEDNARLSEKKYNQFVYHTKMFIINQAKFKAAKEYADHNGYRFGIITEDFFKGRGL